MGPNMTRRIRMKNKQKSDLTRNRRVLAWSLIGLAYFVMIGTVSLYADGWTRGRDIGTFPNSEAPFEPFVLNVWGGDGTHVHGLCAYYNAKSTAVEIGGQETSAGDFYPDVIYEISNGDGDWETLAAPSVNLGKCITTVVKPRTKSRPLRVSLDMFVPFIGKVKYGRIVLQTVESASFRIDELQPPQEKTGRGGPH